MTGTDEKWFTYTNGVHTDSLDPETFNKFLDFLELFVAKRNPAADGVGRAQHRARALPARCSGSPA